MTIYEGQLQGEGVRVAVVCSRFNQLITERLLAGARDGLRRHGVDDASVTVAWVPGAFELPLTAARLAGSGGFDAVICLGAVIRGDTGHYELVAGECAAGIQRAQMDTGVPVIFGVLTTDTLSQALERSGAARFVELSMEVRRGSAGAATGGQSTASGLPEDPADATAGQRPPAAGAGPTAAGGATSTYQRGDHTAPAGTPDSPMGNKGYEAAEAAIEMADLLRQLPKSDRS